MPGDAERLQLGHRPHRTDAAHRAGDVDVAADEDAQRVLIELVAEQDPGNGGRAAAAPGPGLGELGRSERPFDACLRLALGRLVGRRRREERAVAVAGRPGAVAQEITVVGGDLLGVLEVGDLPLLHRAARARGRRGRAPDRSRAG